MSDRWALVLALATAAGAVVAREAPFGLVGAGIVGAVALAVRAPLMLCLASGVLASTLAARAWAGLAPPAATTWSGPVVLATDPAPQRGGALRFEARAGGRRVEAWARGETVLRLADRLAGERVHVGGRLRAVTGRRRAYLAHRHVAARLDIRTVDEHVGGPAPPLAAANAVRRTILHGARVLPDQPRALFAGFVLGDQRHATPETEHAFRRSGLSHLLVVSGSNVAFVLALAHPLLRRLRIGPRFLAGVGVLAFFALLTRGEPSVLRAGVMAGLALLATTLGRPVSTQRLLCLAVTGLLLLDPLLVGSVGFLLSVAATAGIAGLTPRLRRFLPLPLAVTAAAQIGVSPVLIPLFGGVPVVALLANLLAIPAAGPVMMWGLAAGAPAGLAPDAIAAVIHAPTRLLVGWIALVAHRTAASPVADVLLGVPHLCALLAGVVVARAGWRIASRRAARARSP